MKFGNSKLIKKIGNMPQVEEALSGFTQPLEIRTFSQQFINDKYMPIEKITSFEGVFQPLSIAVIKTLPENQRAWRWFWIHSTTDLTLKYNDNIKYNNDNYIVKAINDYSLNGYYEYHIVKDFKQNANT